MVGTLPASKNDTAAEGKTRSLGCACPSALCPVRTMSGTLSQGGGLESPLISTSEGKQVSKKQIVQFYGEVVEVCRLPVGYFTGHSPRVTGAMRMALSGQFAWVIHTKFVTLDDMHARLNVARGIPITGVHGRQTDIVAMESLALQGPLKGEVL